MCQNMNELSRIAKQIYELEQERIKQKKKMEKLEAQIKVLKDEAASYMRKRQKDKLKIDSFEVIFTPYSRNQFDSKAFIANEKDGQELYEKYCKAVQLRKVTVKLVIN